MPGSFFDTNVLLYVASDDLAKADRAEELIGAGGIISVQVLNEITNVARRKMGLSWTETRAFLSMMRGLLPVQPLTIDVHETGLALAERYGLSICDAMIAASALHADCDTLWSEDMQDGIVLDDRLGIVNPFRPCDTTGPLVRQRRRPDVRRRGRSHRRKKCSANHNQ
jgi:predicted nucleic acid-binding protein